MTTGTLPTLLFDTSVISGMVKQELSSIDSIAIRKVIEMAAEGRITIAASTVSKEEIEKIPAAYRSSHSEAYEALGKLQAVSLWLDTTTSSASSSQHPEYVAIRAILRDENDARLAYQAKKAGAVAFVTVDRRTILNKASALAAEGVTVASPSEYLSSTLGSM